MTSDASTTPDPAAPPPPPPPLPPPPPPRWNGQRFPRSREDRVIAGVCAGFARATGTDPVLWRVLLGVLVGFGVFGRWTVAAVAILVYLAGWLFLPEEGDETSPFEALFGRGTSSVSTAVTVTLLVGAALTAATLLGSTSIPAVLLPAGAGLLAYHLYRSRDAAGGPTPAAPPPSPPSPPAEPGGAASAAAYSPAFAPHGPYTDTATVPLPKPPQPPKAPKAPKPPKPPKPPRERSPLGRITWSVMCLALGGLIVVNLLGVSVPAAGYVAVALGVVALGLLVGSAAGRARGLIALGVLLALALGVTTAAERLDGVASGQSGDVHWQPVAVAAVQPAYEHGFGGAVLDLRSVAFQGSDSVATRLTNGAGEVTVLLPPNVDVTVRAEVGAGQIDALGRRSDGLGGDVRATDNGTDGPGGGRLDLRIQLGAGNVEVRREAA